MRTSHDPDNLDPIIAVMGCAKQIPPGDHDVDHAYHISVRNLYASKYLTADHDAGI